MIEDNSDEEIKEGEPASNAGDETTSGVDIPEDFQKQAYNLLEGANKAELNYLQNCVFDCLAKIRNKEADKEFSSDDMPQE